jgi:branched-chain amino acid transport system substrate-binding protein
MTAHRRLVTTLGLFGLGLLLASPAAAQKKYDIGATDTEIKIGNINPYSGPASAYGVNGKTEAAYFRMLNEEKGGINGRKIKFITYDDGYSPPKTVEQARKLVESDEVLLIFGSLGTPTNSAIVKYMNAKKVPQLFVSTGATKFGDYKRYPWTMGWQPNYQSEGRVYAKYLLKHHPQGKIGIIFQNDDYGRDLVKGLKDGLAGRMKIVAEAPYEVQDTTPDSQVVNIKGAGADVLVTVATPKFAAQVIRKVAELGWKPLHVLNNVGASVGAVLRPAGLENSVGILSTGYLKDPTDPALKNDPEFRKWSAFLDKYYPDADKTAGSVVSGYGIAQTMAYVLQQCGDNLTRANIMKQAANMKNVHVDMLRPGVMINTGPTDFYPIEQLQMIRFNGHNWETIGDVINGEIGGS